MALNTISIIVVLLLARMTDATPLGLAGKLRNATAITDLNSRALDQEWTSPDTLSGAALFVGVIGCIIGCFRPCLSWPWVTEQHAPVDNEDVNIPLITADPQVPGLLNGIGAVFTDAISARPAELVLPMHGDQQLEVDVTVVNGDEQPEAHSQGSLNGTSPDGGVTGRGGDHASTSSLWPKIDADDAPLASGSRVEDASVTRPSRSCSF